MGRLQAGPPPGDQLIASFLPPEAAFFGSGNMILVMISSASSSVTVSGGLNWSTDGSWFANSAHIVLPFVVKANGTISAVTKTLEALQRMPVMHRVTVLELTPRRCNRLTGADERQTGRQVGMKPAGGIRVAKEAIQPVGVRITKDGKRAYVANRAAGSISILAIDGNKVQHRYVVVVGKPDRPSPTVISMIGVEQGTVPQTFVSCRCCLWNV